MKREIFQYSTPHYYELKETYPTPYRFSKDLRDHVDMLFSHPHQKFNKLYYNLRTEYDSNDMIKPMYLLTKHFLDYPQQYKHSLDSIHAELLIRAWKTFLKLHKLRGETYSRHMATPLGLMDIADGKLLDMLLDEIKFHRMIMNNDSMVKVREGVGLRDRRVGYSSVALNYYDSLD